MLTTHFPKLFGLLPIALLAGMLAIVLACGGGDDAPTAQPTISITAEDEQAVDKAIADVIAALELRTTTALDSLANEKLQSRPEQLDRLATCFVEGGALSVRNREIKPSTGVDVRLSINFTVTQEGATANSRRDWRFERQADGSFKLSEAPDCPFRRVVPSASASEPTATLATEAPLAEVLTDEVPAETNAPVEL